MEKSISPTGSAELLDVSGHLDNDPSAKRGRKRGMYVCVRVCVCAACVMCMYSKLFCLL